MVYLTRLLAPVFALSAALQGVVASPFAEGTLEVRQSEGGPFAVTGVREGGAAQRREIRQLQGDSRQWNLFLLALSRFQGLQQGRELSYYAVAGIHGQPYIAWDGANGRGGAGYCPHSSNLFGPWHRPYLALIEQRIQALAVQIANSFPEGERAAQRASASTLRLPYWDWASGQIPVLPGSLTSPSIQVRRPTGATATIFNPLFSYRWHPTTPGAFGNFQPLAGYDSTKRWPASGAPNAQSQNNRVEANLRGSANSFRTRTYNLFRRQQSFNHFSNHGSGSDGDTLESLHDNIHASFGPNAHMSFVTFSAFDPIFWFHHCNVDRIQAIWQRLWPNTYVEPFRQPGGTYTIPPGSTQDANSALTPFHRDTNGAFWTSNQARTTNAFGYTYPEIADNPSVQTLTQRITRLYGPQAAGVSRNVAPSARRVVKRAPTLDEISVDIELDITPGEQVYEYIASVTMPLNPIGGTYTLALFFGEYSTEPAAWQTDPNYVGSHSVLAMIDGTNTETLVTGEVVLTQALLQKFVDGDLDGLDKETVEEFIKEQMTWAIQQNGDLVDSSEIPDVSVTLLSNLVKAPTSDSVFPETLDTADLGNITETLGL